MRVLNPRSRMISIRISEEEYADLCRLSAETGAHSLSDLARDAMRMLLNANGPDRFMTDPKGIVQTQIEILNRRIDELREQVIPPEPSKAEEPS